MNWEQDDTFLSKWLNGELSEEDRIAFESSEEGKDFLQLMNASTLIEPKKYETEAELSKLLSNLPNKVVKRAIWLQPNFRLAVAASVAIIIAVVYLFTTGPNTVKTGFGEQEIVMLPDGSEAKINTASSIAYDSDKWDEGRNIDLQGEAFFNVKKGVRFEVKTPNGSVQVLGTSFNVKDRGAFLDVTCYTGKVLVTSKNTSNTLDPGQTVRVENGELVALKEISISEGPSWTRGITELKNVTVSQAIEELQRVFGLKITYRQTLNEVEYTGDFPNQNAEAAIKLVLDPLNIDYTFDANSKELIILGLNK